LAAHDGRRKTQLALLRHAVPLVWKQRRGNCRLRAHRYQRVAQLGGVQRFELLQAAPAAHLRREFGRLLIALDERALDLLLLREGATRYHEH
jgi:hypothetical protein